MKNVLNKGVFVIALFFILLPPLGASALDVKSYLRPLSRLEKMTPEALVSGKGNTGNIMLAYGIASRGDTAFQPNSDEEPRNMEYAVVNNLGALRTLVGIGTRPTLVNVPVTFLPEEFLRTLDGLMVSLSDPRNPVSPGQYLKDQGIIEIVFAPYILETNSAGEIKQPGCLFRDGKLYLAMYEILAEDNTRPVTRVNELTDLSRANRRGVDMKLGGLYSLMETLARIEVVRLVAEKRLPEGKKTDVQRKAQAVILLTFLANMKNDPWKFDPNNHYNATRFADARIEELRLKLREINARLGTEGDFGFTSFGIDPATIPFAAYQRDPEAVSLSSAI